MGKIEIEFVEELMLGQVDKVERQIDAGKDTAGRAAKTWTTLYTNLRGTLDEEPGGGQGKPFGQDVEVYDGKFYFAPLSDGTLPDVRKQDRLTCGQWPDNSPRYLIVLKAWNPYRNDTLLVATFTELRPG